MTTPVETDPAGRGHATGMVLWLLRLEAAAILAGCTVLFFHLGGGVWLFVPLFFAPDLTIAFYALGAKVGAALYNAAHSYTLPVLLAVAGVLLGLPLLWQIALVFIAHAAFDRALGYGLKYAAGFRHTHLGRIGGPGLGES